MQSGNLNFLQPSGPLHACNGTALPSDHLGHLSQTGQLLDAEFRIQRPDKWSSALQDY